MFLIKHIWSAFKADDKRHCLYKINQRLISEMMENSLTLIEFEWHRNLEINYLATSCLWKGNLQMITWFMIDVTNLSNFLIFHLWSRKSHRKTTFPLSLKYKKFHKDFPQNHPWRLSQPPPPYVNRKSFKPKMIELGILTTSQRWRKPFSGTSWVLGFVSVIAFGGCNTRNQRLAILRLLESVHICLRHEGWLWFLCGIWLKWCRRTASKFSFPRKTFSTYFGILRSRGSFRRLTSIKRSRGSFPQTHFN